MTRTFRPRQAVAIALAALIPALFGECSGSYPNSTFTAFSDFNRDASSLWNLMLWLGTGVFILVEVLLIIVMVRLASDQAIRSPGMCTATRLWN